MARGRPDFFTAVREKGVETLVHHTVGAMDPGEVKTLVDIQGRDVELMHLEFSTNYYRSTLMIRPYREDGTIQMGATVLEKGGYTRMDPTPEAINKHQSIAWSELIYDTTNNWFKFGLRYPLRFAHGVKIQVVNPDVTASHDIACEAILMIRG